MSYAYDTIADIIRLSEEHNLSFGDVLCVLNWKIMTVVKGNR